MSLWSGGWFSICKFVTRLHQPHCVTFAPQSTPTLHSFILHSSGVFGEGKIRKEVEDLVFSRNINFQGGATFPWSKWLTPQQLVIRRRLHRNTAAALNGSQIATIGHHKLLCVDHDHRSRPHPPHWLRR